MSMSTNTNSNAQWPDPKDYGLPVVEVKPIHAIPTSSPVSEAPSIEQTEPVAVNEIAPNPAVQTIISERISEQNESKTKEEKPKKPAVTQAAAPKKESKSWIGVAAVLALIIFAVIIWQMM